MEDRFSAARTGRASSMALSRSEAAADFFSGVLATRGVPRILHRVFRDRQTGILQVTDGHEVCQFQFETGELRSSRSDRDEQKLGARLVHENIFGEADLARELESLSNRPGLRFGALLVERGLVSADRLHAILLDQARDIICSTFTWRNGQFAFRPTATLAEPDIALGLSTAAIIVEGVRKLPEDDDFLEEFGNLARPLRLTVDPYSRYQVLRLSPDEAYLLSLCDGRTLMSDLLRMTPPRGRTARTLFALLTCGLVEPSEVAVARAEAIRLADLNVGVDGSKASDGAADAADRRLIEETEARLGTIAATELLGLPPEGFNAAAVEEAFQVRSRKFHPDLRFRPGFEDLGPALERLYVALQDAYRKLMALHRVRMTPVGATEQVEQDSRAQTQARAELARRNYQEARRLLDRNDVYAAIVLLQECIKVNPHNGEYRLRLATALARNPMWQNKAIDQFREALRIEPNRRETLMTMAEYFLSVRRYPEARELTDRLAGLSDDGGEVAELLSRIRAAREAAPPGPADTPPDAGTDGMWNRLFRRKPDKT